MWKRCVAALLACACVSAADPVIPPDAPPNSTFISAGTPPARYRGESAQVILYVNDVATICGKAPEGYKFLACTFSKDGVPVTVLPNPCLFDDEPFAHIACHEKGHVLGWPAYHGD